MRLLAPLPGWTFAAALALSVVTVAQSQAPAAPTDVLPGSITYDDVRYPYPVQYLPFTTQSQDVRMAYMDVSPVGTPNGHVVVLLHGFNFGGFYFEDLVLVLVKEGLRSMVTDLDAFGVTLTSTSL